MQRFLLRAISVTAFVLFGVASARLVATDRRYVLAVVFALLAMIVPPWVTRRRMRQLLLSGDVGRILSAWQGSLRRTTHPEALAPLMSAMAYAAYGFIDAARFALHSASRSVAWEGAVEQRLFVEALVDVYEGERDAALEKAEALERLPLPAAPFWIRRKVTLLRRGIGAFARAFAHESAPRDERLLARVGRSSPLVHWATCYARAVIAVDRGRREEARALIAGAPVWPQESAFRAFHDELTAHIGG